MLTSWDSSKNYGLNMIFKNTPPHFGQTFANQTLEWMPTDTKESYERLIQDSAHREYFASLGWDQPGAITYQLNSQGFRADEFDGGPYLVALGCSYTVGIGLPDQTTWPRQVATQLGLTCANLAWGGYSADTCYRLADYWVPKLRPSYVCMLAPPQHRVELMFSFKEFDTTRIPFEVFMPSGLIATHVQDDHYLKHWFLEEKNALINQQKNIRAIQQLCADLDIPCTIYRAEDHMSRSRDEIGYARDYMHGGPKIHNTLAEKFVEAYVK
jgi:hypothetical protein